jgi:pSer/pThr/pTyr-binding forkhead associated (FHA) protein
MSRRITLTATTGDLKGREFAFRDRATCLVGRARDCDLRVGDDLTVSRYHCLFDIDAPLVSVCDLGSRNGTYVNGEKIGQRDRGEEVNPGVAADRPGRVLREGDEVRVGNTVLRVHIDDPVPGPDEGPVEEASPAAACAACR